MSSCQSNSKKELSDSEKQELTQQLSKTRIDQVTDEFRKEAFLFVTNYLSVTRTFIDMAFEIELKDAIIAGLEDVIKTLKGEDNDGTA